MNVLDYGITTGKNAIAFYEALADKTLLLSLKNLFISLSHDEQDHLDMISTIKGNPEIKLFYQPELDILARILKGLLTIKDWKNCRRKKLTGIIRL